MDTNTFQKSILIIVPRDVNETTTAAIENRHKTPQPQRPVVDKGTVGAIKDKTNMIQSSEAASGGPFHAYKQEQESVSPSSGGDPSIETCVFHAHLAPRMWGCPTYHQ
ncbi:hypothetical protein TNCV_675021 [Trichonephila clavipes]|nr:hypothetical protein TNCV_675021 [Trichonephila clavipes]